MMYAQLTTATRSMALVAAVLVAGFATPSRAATADSTQSDATTAPWAEADWDRQLRTYVDAQGGVAYRDWFTHDRDALAATIESMAQADPSAWPQAQQLAFWINAYNAGTVWAVSQGRSAESLLGRGKLFHFWKFRVAGQERSLNDVEHEILRREFDEPRIHFAIVCASTSCPVLRNEAYSAGKLEAQLQEQARRFCNDPERNRIEVATRTVRLSKIFDWFAEDFERDGSVLHYVAQFVDDEATRQWLQNGAPDADRGHLSYDWTLNAQPGQRPR